jgi:hypothetical protein
VLAYKADLIVSAQSFFKTQKNTKALSCL